MPPEYHIDLILFYPKALYIAKGFRPFFLKNAKNTPVLLVSNTQKEWAEIILSPLL